MTQIAAVGDGPIVFVTDAGQQLSLPLAEIFFDGNGVNSSNPEVTGAFQDWLKYLVAQGRLGPGKVPAPGIAMVFTAVAPGSTGNNIVVTVAQNTDPAKVDVTVTETDTYEGLTLGSLPNVIGGTSGPPGTRPSLVRAQVAPSAPDPIAGSAVLVAATNPPNWTVAGPVTGGNPTTSFTLVAARTGSAPTEWTIAVSNVQQPATGSKTFTLTVTWTKKVTAVSGLGDLNPQLGFAVTVSAPDGYKRPKPGSINLAGGTEPTAATPARATLPASA